MTQKLFENDSFLFRCEGNVIACIPFGDKFEVILDQTVFFPEGGGQPGDTGIISGVRVLDTYYKEGEIIHLCESPLSEGALADARIDAERRLDHIQQHTGEHMLSYAFWKLFGAVNVGFHMNEETATIDLDFEPSPDQITAAERFANREIYENLPIKVYESTLSQLKNKKVRKISQKAGEHPRVVEIEGSDICTCCGTHAKFTGTVGIIKVIKSEKMRSGVRLEFLCGGRALRFFEQEHAVSRIVSSGLSTDFSNVPDRIGDMKTEISCLKTALREKTETVAEYRAKELLREAENGLAVAVEENMKAGEARTLLNRLTADESMAAVVIFADREKVGFVCAAGKKSALDCKYICELLCSLYNGKGGGSKNFSQGAGSYSSDWKERAQMFRKHMEVQK